MVDPTWERCDVENFPDGYRDLGRIASGGMGEVRRAFHRHMRRVVALKLLHRRHLENERILKRFEHEVEVTTQLDHPGVVAIFDRGSHGGRPFFAMQEVRGQTFRRYCDELFEGAEGDSGALHRGLGVLLRFVETLAYAHSQGIVHRDIKPSNLMVGAFGEALVMDWGIARKVDAQGPLNSLPEQMRPEDFEELFESNEDGVLLTQTGDVLGTLSYMAPEQARNQEVSPAADVYALGLVLFEVLTGAPAYSGGVAALWQRLGHVGPSVLGERLRQESRVDAEGLVGIVEKATHGDAKERYSTASGFGIALRAWLEGEDRRRRGAELLQKATEEHLLLDDARGQWSAALQRCRSYSVDLDENSSVEARQALWALEDEAKELRRQVEAAESSLAETLRFGLFHDPSSQACRNMLLSLAAERVLRHEEGGQGAEAEHWLGVLREHDRGTHEDFVGGRATVAAPVGMASALVPFEEQGRRLVLGKAIALAGEHRVSAGSYLLEHRRPGCEVHRRPVVLGRGERYVVEAPRMLRAGVLGCDDVFVPEGVAPIGGDPLAAEPLQRERIWIDAFVMRRHPITNAEYLEFLNDLVAAGKDAGQWAPRLHRGAASGGSDEASFRRTEDGKFTLSLNEHGVQDQPDWPVTLIDWYSAVAYCEWLATKTGKPWRLPSELEWEKAGRGADGRPFPWGRQAEATWARLALSAPMPPERHSVEGFPIDESPYGVRGLAGNVRDWCLESWMPQGPERPRGRLTFALPKDDSLRAVRGGSWSSSPEYARLAARFAAAPSARFPVLGFRVARSVLDEEWA